MLWILKDSFSKLAFQTSVLTTSWNGYKETLVCDTDSTRSEGNIKIRSLKTVHCSISLSWLMCRRVTAQLRKGKKDQLLLPLLVNEATVKVILSAWCVMCQVTIWETEWGREWWTRRRGSRHLVARTRDDWKRKWRKKNDKSHKSRCCPTCPTCSTCCRSTQKEKKEILQTIQTRGNLVSDSYFQSHVSMVRWE